MRRTMRMAARFKAPPRLQPHGAICSAPSEPCSPPPPPAENWAEGCAPSSAFQPSSPQKKPRRRLELAELSVEELQRCN